MISLINDAAIHSISMFQGCPVLRRKAEYSICRSAIPSLHVGDAAYRASIGARSRRISARAAPDGSVGASRAVSCEQACAVADVRDAAGYARCRRRGSRCLVASNPARDHVDASCACIQRRPDRGTRSRRCALHTTKCIMRVARQLSANWRRRPDSSARGGCEHATGIMSWAAHICSRHSLNEPATPADLAAAVGKLAELFQVV